MHMASPRCLCHLQHGYRPAVQQFTNPHTASFLLCFLHVVFYRFAHRPRRICVLYMACMCLVPCRPTPAHVAALCLVRPSLTWQQRQAARAACGVEAETWDPALPCMAPLHQPQDLGMRAGDASSDACLPVPVAGSSANDGCPACTGPMRLHQSLVWPHAWEQLLGTTHMHPAALPPALQANEAADGPAQHAQLSHMHDADAPPPGCSALLGQAAGWGSIIGSTCGWEEPQQELACNLL